MNYLIYLSLGLLLAIFGRYWWKWKKRAILITHSGNYHLDDVFATAILIQILKKEKKFFQIIRTRDDNLIEFWRQKRTAGREVYIYDIGGVYDEEKNEFDHHQIGGADVRENGIEYSSAGLVWKKFGYKLLKSDNQLWKIEKKIFLAIDALDNGQSICEYKYDFFAYDLRNLTKLYLPVKKSKNGVKKAFLKSVKLAEFILEREIQNIEKLLLDEKKVDRVFENSEDKRVLLFEEGDVSLSSITENHPEVLFTISKKEDNVWVIETVIKKWGSFKRRKYFPESWGGLNESDLDKVTGLEGGIFCHRGLFIASAKSKETAIKMAEIALENKK